MDTAGIDWCISQLQTRLSFEHYTGKPKKFQYVCWNKNTLSYDLPNTVYAMGFVIQPNLAGTMQTVRKVQVGL